MTRKIWLFSGFIILLMTLYFAGLQSYMSLDVLKAYQAEYSTYYHRNPATSLILYSLLFIAFTIVSIPATAILTVAAGALFGFIPGVLISLFSAVTGAVFAFLLARHYLGEGLQEKYCDQLKLINDGVAQEGGFYLFSLRVMPIMPFCLINFLMGLTQMKLLKYVLITIIGALSWVVIYVYAGTTLRTIKSLEDIISTEVFMALILLGLFPLLMKKIIPLISEKKRKKHAA